MAARMQEFDPEVIATTLISVVQNTFKSKTSLEFSEEPTSKERELIEYDRRMRVFGMEKFNGPCYTASVSFYLTEKHMASHDACGVINVFIEQETAGRLLKAFGYAGSDGDDEEKVLENYGEFCGLLADNFKNELVNIGFKDLRLSSPIKQKNDIDQGVDFPYSQYRYHETEFHLWRKKALVVDVVMSPSGLM